MTDSYYVINTLENFYMFSYRVCSPGRPSKGTISLIERNGATKVFKLKQMFPLVLLKIILLHDCLDQNSSILWTEGYQSRLYTMLHRHLKAAILSDTCALLLLLKVSYSCLVSPVHSTGLQLELLKRTQVLLEKWKNL